MVGNPWRIRIGTKGNCESKCDGYLCTRNARHKGVHAAHGASSTTPVAYWRDGDTRPTEPKRKSDLD